MKAVIRLLLATGLMIFAGAVALPGLASAHAVLEESSPARGAALEKAPPEVTFTFNEPVEANFGAVRVFDTEGREVQEEGDFRPGDSSDSIGAKLPASLEDGVYTATYRVVSADAHPISGGLVFTIGDGGGVAGKTISELLAMNDVGPVTEIGFGAVRWVGYMAIAIAVGLIAFVLLVWAPVRTRFGVLDEGADAAAGRARLILAVSVLAGILASLLAIAFQGATAAGTDLWSALKPDVMREVIDTRYGTVMLVRAGAWLLVAVGARAVLELIRRDHARPTTAALLVLVPALLLAVTPALGGHASTQDPAWLLVPSDAVHVAAMAVWTGGLFALITVLPAATRRLADAPSRTAGLTAFLLRFSTVALAAVALIAVSGTIQALIEVASFSALVDTPFGRAVLIKIVLFAVLIAVAAVNRRRLIPELVIRRDKRLAPGRVGVSARRNLRIEVLLVTAVIAVSAALVSYPPPTVAQAGPISGDVSIEADRLEYTVDPGRAGSNEVHVYLFDDRSGAPIEVDSVEIAFSLPDSEIAPIEADVSKAGPGHYVVPAAMLAVKGDWEAQVAVRFSRFDERIATFEVPIR